MNRRAVLAGAGAALSTAIAGCSRPSYGGECASDATLDLVVDARSPAFERVHVDVTTDGSAVLSETYELEGDENGFVARERDVLRQEETYTIEAAAGDRTATETVEVDCFAISVGVDRADLGIRRLPREG